MKLRTSIITYGILFGVFVAVTGYEFLGQKGAAKGTSPTVTSGESEDPYDGFVETPEGTEVAMLTPDYWLMQSGDEILFSKEEIYEFNENNPAYVEYGINNSVNKKKLYMNELQDKLKADVVTALIDPGMIEELSRGKNQLYANGEEIDAGYFDKIRDNLGLEKLQEEVEPIYAVCIERADARTLPTDDFIAEDPDELYFDSLISAEIMPGAGVVILAHSMDGNWDFVLNGSYCGWVHREKLAVCSDKAQWLEATTPKEFLVVTGSEIILEETAAQSRSSGRILPMGTKIKLTASGAESVSERLSWGCFTAQVPCRDDEGKLIFEDVLIPVSKDVHVGYPDMTSRLVLEQAFKFLGKIYGYGGTLSSNDCSGFVRQVYACFGFELPRNARAIAETGDLGSIECTKMTTDKKINLLLQMPPGMLLYMEGHIMMYLGTKEGNPYVISSCATCIEPGHDTSETVGAYGVFVSGMDMLRANGNTWLEDMNYILWREY